MLTGHLQAHVSACQAASRALRLSTTLRSLHQKGRAPSNLQLIGPSSTLKFGIQPLVAACFAIASTAHRLTRRITHKAGPWGARSVTRSAVNSAWVGTRSQEELMAVDECILVDENDAIIGGASKAASHKRQTNSEHAKDAFRLHRAFSVFLFDHQNRLLLQQRAHTKITFPLVWTNTCCSHPLHGQEPSEVDMPEYILEGSVPGVKRAAARKLLHELGIPSNQVPESEFKFLTRLHYCAADPFEPDPDKWGEHEMDYILLIRAAVDITSNPDEVEDARYVDPKQLSSMMCPSSGLLWSPWFRILADKFLPSWWANLDDALRTDKFVDGRIHRIGFD